MTEVSLCESNRFTCIFALQNSIYGMINSFSPSHDGISSFQVTFQAIFAFRDALSTSQAWEAHEIFSTFTIGLQNYCSHAYFHTIQTLKAAYQRACDDLDRTAVNARSYAMTDCLITDRACVGTRHGSNHKRRHNGHKASTFTDLC